MSCNHEDFPCCGCDEDNLLTEQQMQELDEAYYNDMPHDGDFDWMDGDHESGLASAGWGTDEDYGYYGDDGDF